MVVDRLRLRLILGDFQARNVSCTLRRKPSGFSDLEIGVVSVARLDSVRSSGSTLGPTVSSLLFSKPLKTHISSVGTVGFSGPMLARFHHLNPATHDYVLHPQLSYLS